MFQNTETLSLGDMLNSDNGNAALARSGDTMLLGACQATVAGTRSTSAVRAIVDADAIYGVDDARARRQGELLELDGLTGAQGVSVDGSGEFIVMKDSAAGEETLVHINPNRHYKRSRPREPVSLTGGKLNAAVARAVVRHHREYLGRGPTKAQAFYRDRNLVVILGDVMTAAEHSLLEAGADEAVLQMRQAIQQAMRDELVATVEKLSGCEVVAFMSSNSLDPDMAAEVFVLDRPVPRDPPDARPPPPVSPST